MNAHDLPFEDQEHLHYRFYPLCDAVRNALFQMVVQRILSASVVCGNFTIMGPTVAVTSQKYAWDAYLQEERPNGPAAWRYRLRRVETGAPSMGWPMIKDEPLDLSHVASARLVAERFVVAINVDKAELAEGV